MKKVLSLLFLCVLFAIGHAQVLKERRVYYLDCSYSMVLNKIWDEVRTNLMNAIDNISDETTELVVIPFADNNLKDPVLKPMVAYATAEGKNTLKSYIKALKTNKNTMTYHYIPINDFYENRVSSDRITYMFLMTDGKDEDEQKRALNELLPQWSVKYGNRNVYGFYVMLHKLASDLQIDNVCNNQDHLWKVETADVNINLIRLQPNSIFNAKNDEYFDLPIYGDLKNMMIEAQFVGDSPYKVKKVECFGSSLRVWVDFNRGISLPVSVDTKLQTKLNGGGLYDFLVTDNISVKCEYKPERSLKISVR